MYSETIELTYSHQDLGALNEFGLMCLFGSLHSKALVRGLSTTVEDIRDAHGRQLYPAYFHTHLRVPTGCELESFGAWKPVQAGVEVRRFGKCYLDSTYVIKPGSGVEAGATALTAEDVQSGKYPTMRGNNLFIVDVCEDASVARQLAVPDAGTVASLDAVKEKPAAIQRVKDVARNATVSAERAWPLSTTESIAYAVVPGRDVAVGHAMIFARFAQVMDYAEHAFFTEQLGLELGDEERAGYRLREREIFYLSNAYAGDTIDVAVRAAVAEVMDGGERRLVVETEYRLYRRSNLELLAVGTAKKEAVNPAARRVFSPLATAAVAPNVCAPL